MDMTGKTCIVTGANSGIGKATAKGLARLGARVILACRDIARGEAALDEVIAQPGCQEAALELVDLASFESIRAFADRMNEQEESVQVLVNNAAIVPGRRKVSVDGIELQLAVNHLAPFLLTHLLVDTLRANAPARVITVSSRMHWDAAIPWDDIQSEQTYKALKVYGWTKLGNILFTRELARRLDGTGVTANSLHPGFVGTNIASRMPFPLAQIMRVVNLFILSPEDGAKTSIHLAASSEEADVSGEYFRECRIASVSDAARDDASARRLWALSEELAGIDSADYGLDT